jgi:HD-GYP domain-containing protein (c-di-GMP phosphodiesterase class II)/DNA-binding LacI/PurR family transcriptional regulator
MASGSSSRRTIGFITNGISGWYEQRVWLGVQAAARVQDVNLLCFSGAEPHVLPAFTYSAADQALSTLDPCFKLANPENVDGILVMTSAMTAHTPCGLVEELCRGYAPLPIISLGAPLADMTSIGVDNAAGMRDLVEHLVNEHHCQRIAYISGPETNAEALQRRAVYLELMAKYELPLEPELVVYGNFTQPSGERAAEQLMAGKIEFDALLAANDDMAVGALEALQRHGIKVPGDVLLAGFDDTAESRITTPTLTTVAQSPELLGERGLEMVLTLLEGKPLPASSSLPSRLIIRQSCGCFSATVRLAGEGKPETGRLILSEESHQGGKNWKTPLVQSVSRANSCPEDEAAAITEEILEAFGSDLKNKFAGKFLAKMKYLIQSGLERGCEPESWQEVISVMRWTMRPSLFASHILGTAENLWHQARALISEIVAISHHQSKKSDRLLVFDIQSIGRALSYQARQEKDIAAIMEQNFPRLGVERCYVSLFDQPDGVRSARLMAAYGAGMPLPEGGLRFESAHLAPPGWLPEEARSTRLVQPLRFQAEELGFVLFEGAGSDGQVCEYLRSALGNAIRSIQLLGTLRQETSTLQTTEQAMRRQLEELTALHRISLTASTVLETDSLLHYIAAQVDQLIMPDCSFIALYREQERGFRVAIAQQDGKPVLEGINTLIPLANGGLISIVISGRQPILMASLDTPPLPVEPWASGENYQTWLGVPMIARDKVVGVISVYSHSAEAFDENDRLFLESLASQVAIILENTQLFEDALRRANRLAALHEIDTAITSSPDLQKTLGIFLDQAIDQLNVDAACILRYRPSVRVLHREASRGFRGHGMTQSLLSVTDDIAGRAVLERKIIHIPDLTQAVEGQPRAMFLLNEEFVSYYAVPLIAKENIKGVLEIFNRKPLPTSSDWVSYLKTLATQAAIAIDNSELFKDLQHTNEELIQAYDTTLEGWSRALDMRDRETEGHTQRVSEMTVRLALTLGVQEADVIHIRRGALLHDIGKMGIPDNILLKPGPLNGDEIEIMHQHPAYAYKMLAPITFLRPALDIPYCHHENWDGTGYPRGLKEEQIPLAARIFALVDVWDALISSRPYRAAWGNDQAIAYIRSQTGKRFDPKLVELFLGMVESEKAAA